MNRKLTGKLLILLTMGLLACIQYVGVALAEISNPQAIKVRVVPSAEVSGEQYALGEIAELDGFDPDTLQKLARVQIGKSPLPGKAVHISESWLKARLRQWSGPTLEIMVPPDAQVVRAGQRIRGEEIEQMILSQAAKEFQGPESANLKQQLLGNIHDVVLPKGQLHWEITPMGQHLVEGGNRKFTIVARVAGQEAWRGYARIRQQVYSQVLVAAKPIRRGQVVKPGDLKSQGMNLSNNRGEAYLTSRDQAVGRQAQRPIGKGEPLRAGLLTNPDSIGEGGKVTLVYKNGSLELRTLGVAMVKGKSGQFIPVRNLESGKIVYGTVQKDDTVRVD